MTNQLPLPATQPDSAAADDARAAERAEYLERLREKLKDSTFRAIEGFPIGEDDAILALSDPPYYTACPNPFLPEIVERWQAERAQLREDLDLPDDADDNGDGKQPVYHREPFASDVSEGKNNPIYNAHSYHTKVPHKAIMRYILHYTDPGDVVFDGFCGTGMTGVAAQLCGDRQAVEDLGYRVGDDGAIHDGDELVSCLGARKAALVDLSPAATFIAYNYNTPVDVVAFEREANRILREVEDECGWMYETWHPHCEHPQRVKGHINYTVWSDVFVCPQCGEEIIFWNAAVDKDAGKVRDPFPCPGCDAEQSKRALERAWETVYDSKLGQVVRHAKQAPVLVNYSVGKKRYEKPPDTDDLALIHRIKESDIPHWFPTNRMPEGKESRRNDDIGITRVPHFYTKRNWWILAAIWERCNQLGNFRRGMFLRFCATASMLKTSKRIMFAPSRLGGGSVITGALYIPALCWEKNVVDFVRRKVRATSKAGQEYFQGTGQTSISTESSHQILLPSSCIDYVFIDPPFGSNLMYSELSFIWEAWLQSLTKNTSEAIVNSVQGKGLYEYQKLMEVGFCEAYRLLKPGRWMTVEFHNTKNAVWNSIQEAILRAGFVVADVRVLDKKHTSFIQQTSTSTAKKDLVISAYKPRTGFERRFLEQSGTPNGAWAFIRQHLAQLPVVVKTDGALEAIAERQSYLLFDRMVAFHIQRGASVPLSAAQFYAGLRERFVERDGMYFLPDQVPEYDRARLQAAEVAQLTLFVSDEKSTIQWLRQQLDPATGGQSQTYQELQPQFLRQLHQARHEVLPELSEMLEQNFLQDETGHWYVADPGKADDLEKLRRRALLREFNEYVEGADAGRSRLRKFRTEAVRAGFADAWRRRDYATIVKVAERLPERVLQEDPDLLMYYDNAALRDE